MGRKGVNKRKKTKEKAGAVSGNNSASGGHKAENQPERVTGKGKATSKDRH